jgi:hypothetical protein
VSLRCFPDGPTAMLSPLKLQYCYVQLYIQTAVLLCSTVYTNCSTARELSQSSPPVCTYNCTGLYVQLYWSVCTNHTVSFTPKAVSLSF